jgi:hypothetical protein
MRNPLGGSEASIYVGSVDISSCPVAMCSILVTQYIRVQLDAISSAAARASYALIIETHKERGLAQSGW